jgi:integrase
MRKGVKLAKGTKPKGRRGPFKVIRSGSVSVPIYKLRHRHAAGGFVYAIAWHVGGVRKMRQFTDLTEAANEAKLKAEQLAAGKVEAASLTADDANTLIELRRLAGETPLAVAMQEWRKARDMVGTDLLHACEQWAQRHGKELPKKTVSDAVDDFIAAKKRQGVDTSASYDRSLPAFKTEFANSQLRNLSAAVMQAWLDRTYAHPVSRNTVRSRVVTLFRWARKQGFLPRDMQTEAERTEQAREAPMEIGIITPETFRATLRLMKAKAPNYVPALVVACFCGLRRAEIHGQDWRDIELGRKFVRVTRAKKGTPARRLVPLPDAAIEWLLEHRKAEGPLCSNLSIDRIRDIARTAGVDLPDNCFRHSFITYRVALTGNIPETSMEAGNSVAMIHAHYRELATKAEAEAWFGITPAEVAAAPEPIQGKSRAEAASPAA